VCVCVSVCHIMYASMSCSRQTLDNHVCVYVCVCVCVCVCVSACVRMYVFVCCSSDAVGRGFMYEKPNKHSVHA